ncbi:hypothetical protein KSP40_PGU013053 [Platanthera guangdongensis]|uniref:Transposase n=1 Tax=Platanthera guangdongensis TaxID=2320717 RepID=A0ABR2LM93_9ASPA
MRLRSSLTEDDVDIWRKKYGLPADLEVRIPRPEERVQNPPLGWLTICEVSLRSGFCFPPCEELVEILRFCGVPISQFVPAGIALIMGLVAFFRGHGGQFSLDQFRDWCDVRSDGGERMEVRSNKAWLEFEARKDRRHGNTLFGYVKNSWSLPEVWDMLPDRCRRVRGKERDFSPMLGFSEPRELVNRLFSIYVYVEEKRLVQCGISADPGRPSNTSRGGDRKRKAVTAPPGDLDMVAVVTSEACHDLTPEVQILTSPVPPAYVGVAASRMSSSLRAMSDAVWAWFVSKAFSLIIFC